MAVDAALLIALLVGGGGAARRAPSSAEVARDGYGVRVRARGRIARTHRSPVRACGRGGRTPALRRRPTVAAGSGSTAPRSRSCCGRRLGVGPWDVLAPGRRAGRPGCRSASSRTGSAPCCCSPWWPLRQRPGIGTLANVLLVGTSAQLVLDVTRPVDGPVAAGGAVRRGMVLLAVATGVYVGAGLGAGPRDGLMLGLHRRLGLPVWLARTLVEGTALLGGWLLGGDVGHRHARLRGRRRPALRRRHPPAGPGRAPTPAPDAPAHDARAAPVPGAALAVVEDRLRSGSRCARIMSLPSSVMRSGPQGGIHTQLIRKRSTWPSRACAVSSSITSVSGQPAEVSVMLMTRASFSSSQLRS